MNTVINRKFDSFSIIYDDKEIIKCSYENFCMNSFVNILNDNFKNKLIVGVEDEEFNIIFLIILAYETYLKNMKNQDNSLINNLSIGDKISYGGKRGTFSGINEMNGKKYVKIMRKNNDYDYIPIESAYNIIPYKGQAKTSNKMTGFHIEPNLTRRVVASLFNENVHEFISVVNQSNLIVVPSKSNLDEILSKLYIKFADNKYLFTKVFPCAYYSSYDKFDYYSGNEDKENALLRFTSRLGTALDMVRLDKDIENVIIMGEKNYKDKINGTIDIICKRKSVKQVIIIDRWDSTGDFNEILNSDINFNIYALTKSLVLSNINIVEKRNITHEPNMVGNARLKIENFLYRTVDYKIISVEDWFIQSIITIKEKLRALNSGNDNEELLEFTRISYYLCKVFQSVILPLKYNEQLKLNIDSKLRILWETCDLYKDYTNDFALMREILSNIKLIHEYLEESNPKLRYITSNYKNYRKLLILIRESTELEMLAQHLNKVGLRNVHVSKIRESINFTQYDDIVITFAYDNTKVNIFDNVTIASSSYIVYKSEYYIIKNLIKNRNSVNSIIEEKNEFKKYFQYDEDSELNNLELENNDYLGITETNQDQTELKFDNYVEDLIKASIIYNIGSHNYTSTGGQFSSVSKLVTFDNGNYALFTNFYEANVIDWDKGNIVEKDIKEIKIGDELVFVREMRENGSDIIMNIIYKLCESSGFDKSSKDSVYLNDLWKERLKQYITDNFLRVSDISIKFRRNGMNIEPITINNWLYGSTIGPRDGNTFDIISKILNDAELESKLDSIKVSCKTVRRLHVQVRKAVAKIIMHSFVSDKEVDSEIYKLINETIGNIDDYSERVIIENITDIQKEVPSNSTNRLLSMESD